MNEKKEHLKELMAESASKELIQIIQRLHNNIGLMQSQETIEQCTTLQNDYMFGRIDNPYAPGLGEKRNQFMNINNLMAAIKKDLEVLCHDDFGHNFEDEKANLFNEACMIAKQLVTIEKNIGIIKAGANRIFSSPMQLIIEENVKSLENCIHAFTKLSEDRRDLYAKFVEQSEKFLQNGETK